MPKREALTGPNIPEHNQPFPPAVKVGNMVFSAAVGGDDPETHEIPEDIEAQVKNMFQNVRNIMERAGGSPADIAKASVYVKDRDDRKFINPEWIKMFPDEDDRPVRHTSIHDMVPGRKVQIEFIAVMD
jgi:2-iminobutanoate/2-iminopropanoate deaminase